MFNEYSSKTYNVSEIEENIIIGSLLGDGSLALYNRSKNSYYREHGCENQLPYRMWKYEKLKNLDFKINRNYKYAKIYSHCNIYFTNLYNKFYFNNIKTITEENIKLLTHPIGLSCLYMDDGSLVIDSTKRKNNSIYIFPRISLYTLSFSENENIILKNHLETTFGVKTKIKYRKDGKNTILEINKKNDIINFIDIVKPYVCEIPCMKYKINLSERFEEKKNKLKEMGYKNINSWDKTTNCNYYTKSENLFIIKGKENGMTAIEISKTLNRSYWGIVDKLRRLNFHNN